MSKRRPDKESHYKGIINKQKSIIKELKKKAGRGDKIQDRLEDLELELSSQLKEEEEALKNKESVAKALKCPECGKGELELVDLKVKKLYICNICKYRRTK